MKTIICDADSQDSPYDFEVWDGDDDFLILTIMFFGTLATIRVRGFAGGTLSIHSADRRLMNLSAIALVVRPVVVVETMAPLHPALPAVDRHAYRAANHRLSFAVPSCAPCFRITPSTACVLTSVAPVIDGVAATCLAYLLSKIICTG